MIVFEQPKYRLENVETFDNLQRGDRVMVNRVIPKFAGRVGYVQKFEGHVLDETLYWIRVWDAAHIAYDDLLLNINEFKRAYIASG